MLNKSELAANWKQIVAIYGKTIEFNNPEFTVKKIVETLGIESSIETFAVVTRLKQNDGRIYGENRNFMNRITVNEDAVKWEHGNPMIYAGLDDIHTSHINDLITEIRKLQK